MDWYPRRVIRARKLAATTRSAIGRWNSRRTQTKGPRVVIVVQNLPVPYDRRVWLEATTLHRAGYDVTVVCPATDDFRERRLTLEGVRIRRYWLPFDGSSAASLVLEFAWALAAVGIHLADLRRRGPIHVLHACNPPETYWVLARLFRLGGTKFLFDHHDLSPEMYRAKFAHPNKLVHRALLWLERRTYQAADGVITTNESYRRIVSERAGYDPASVTVVRSGPSLDRFTRMDPDPRLRQGRRHLLVFLGEIGEQDGVDALIRVVRSLTDRGLDIHCLVIGGGPHQPAIVAYAEELGVADRCTFTGRIGDDLELSRLLSSADIGVVPDPNTDWSRFSTMNKVMEYMFFGLPVAAFDLPETRTSAGDAAAYAKPDDTEDLARIIAELLEDPDRRREMGERGVQRLRGELAWEHSVAPLLAAYGRLAPVGSNSD